MVLEKRKSFEEFRKLPVWNTKKLKKEEQKVVEDQLKILDIQKKNPELKKRVS